MQVQILNLIETHEYQLTIRVVVDQIKAVTVVDGSHVRLRNPKTDTIREALAERARGNLNTVSVPCLGMSRSE